MAEQVEAVATRRGRGGAWLLTLILLLITVVALAISWLALHRANIAEQKANQAISKTRDLNTKVDNAVGTLNQASTGGGTGSNNPQPAATNNTTPNGNGQ
jgi:outer membrane murein-binding lipoprotein Lpp